MMEEEKKTDTLKIEALFEMMKVFTSAMESFAATLSDAMSEFVEAMEIDESTHANAAEEFGFPVPKITRTVMIGQVKYILPDPPAEFLLAQYPGGRVLTTSNDINDVIRRWHSHSPETVTVSYRKFEKQPWMPLEPYIEEK